MKNLIKSNLLIVLALLLSSCSTDSTSSLLDDLSSGGVDETNLEEFGGKTLLKATVVCSAVGHQQIQVPQILM